MDDAPRPSPPARPARKWAVRLAVAALLAVVFLLALRALVLPRVVRHSVNSALLAAGLQEARFEIRRTTPWGIDLADLAIGRERVARIRDVRVTFTPLSLLRGRVDRITLTGAEARIGIDQKGRIDLGALAPTPADRPAPADTAAKPRRLPFERITLADSILDVAWEDQRLRIPLHAVLAREGGEILTLNAQAQVHDVQVTLIGTIDPDRNVALAAETASFDPAQLIAMLPTRLSRQMPADLGGTISLRADYATTQDSADAWGLSALADFVIDGSAPPRLLDFLRARGIDAAQLGSATVTGQLTFSSGTGREEERQRWKLAGSELRLDLSEGNLLLPDQGVSLHGLAGVVPLSLEADEQILRLRVLPGAHARVSGIEQQAADVAISRIDPEGPLASAGINGPPAELLLRPGGQSADRWQLDLPAVYLSIAEADLALREDLHLDHAEARISIRALGSPAGFELFAIAGSHLSFQALLAEFEGRRLEAGAGRITLAGSAPELIAVLSNSGTKLGELSFRTSGIPLSARSDGMEFQAERLSVAGTLKLDSQPPAARVLVNLNNARAAFPAHELAVNELSASIPVLWNLPDEPAQEAASFDIGSVVYKGRTHHGPRGTVALTESNLEFTADWLLLEELARVTATGRIDWSGDELRGEIAAELPESTITDPLTIAEAHPALTNHDITGTFAGRARITFAGGKVTPEISLRLDRVDVISPFDERAIRGVSGTVAFDSFDPLNTAGVQRLQIKELSISQLTLTNGVLNLAVDDAQIFRVEQTAWDWAGGRVDISPFRLDLRSPRVQFVATGRDLNLAQIVALVAGERISGQGSVHGRLPITIGFGKALYQGEVVTAWDQPEIEFGEGFLAAAPGGRLRMANPEELVGDIIERQDPRFARGGPLASVKENLLAALRDLDFSTLRVDFIQEPTGLMAQAHLAGKGLQRDALEIGGLTLRIHNFDELLKTLVQLREAFPFGD